MIITPLCHKIFVRYARKPIWFPTAPSKLFRIPEHKFYSPEEITQIRILTAAYWAQERAIAEFMKHEFFIPASQAGGLPVEFIEKELERDKELYKENDDENAKIAKLKEEMLGKKLAELEEKVMEEKLNREEQSINAGQMVDKYILEQISDPHSVVTPDNIDVLIEKAMENPVDFQFFIDPSGRQYKGSMSQSINRNTTKPDTRIQPPR